MTRQPSWLPQLAEIIRQAQGIIKANDRPGMHSEPDEYTHTDDLRSCSMGGLELSESGNPEVAYHLVVYPLCEDEVDINAPLLEIKIRPYRLWLDKLKELSEQQPQAKSAKPVAAH